MPYFYFCQGLGSWMHISGILYFPPNYRRFLLPFYNSAATCHQVTFISHCIYHALFLIKPLQNFPVVFLLFIYSLNLSMLHFLDLNGERKQHETQVLKVLSVHFFIVGYKYNIVQQIARACSTFLKVYVNFSKFYLLISNSPFFPPFIPALGNHHSTLIL